MISHSDLVISYFGYWPEFADANIIAFAWTREDAIEMTLHYLDSELSREAVVGLRFSGVKNVKLDTLLHQNVVDCLSIVDGDPIKVDLEACYGLDGEFTCSAVEVTGVAPNNSSKPTPLRGAA